MSQHSHIDVIAGTSLTVIASSPGERLPPDLLKVHSDATASDTSGITDRVIEWLAKREGFIPSSPLGPSGARR